MAGERRSGFGVGFSKEVEAILAAGQLGALYPHEIRANLRIAGMLIDKKVELPDFPDPYDLPQDYEPDFGEPEDDDEEEAA